MAKTTADLRKNAKGVLFICLGNICRSPIAEGIFRSIVSESGTTSDWVVDSAAIGSWHVGEDPDPRATKALQVKGIRNYSHKVRQIEPEDFKKFHFIFGMDNNNIKALNDMKPPDFTGVIALLGSYDPSGETIIRDPYYDNDDRGFHKCYEQCIRACEAFFKEHHEKKATATDS